MAWAPDYVDVIDLRDYLRIVDSDDDVELAFAISAAARAVDHDTGRQFGKVDVAEVRTYYARPDYCRGWWVLDVDDYQTAAGLVVTVVGAGAVTTFTKEPVNAAAKGRPWTRIVFTADSQFQPDTHPHEVSVTAVWGWTAIPATVKQATLLQAARFYTRRQAPFGVAGSPDQGSELRLLAKVDPDVAVTLRNYRRIGRIG